MRPTDIKLHQKSRELELLFDDGQRFELPCEYLRVFSPSAEFIVYSSSQRVLQTGKRNINISEIRPVGHYAVCLVFSDGHDTGIYTWGNLHELGMKQDQNWQQYLGELEAAGASRDPI